MVGRQTQHTTKSAMRQGQGSKRSRNRGGGNRRGGRQQSFDSNGPSVRIRGSAQQIHEKYLTLARDASSSGDRVAAENYSQHAEHYHRVLVAEAEQREQRNNQHGGRNQKGNGRDHNASKSDDKPSDDAVIEMKNVSESGKKGEKSEKSKKSKKSKESGDVAVEAIATEKPAEDQDRAVGD